MINSTGKGNRVRKGFIWVTYPGSMSVEGSQDRKIHGSILGARTEKGIMEGASYWFAQIACLHNPGPPAPGRTANSAAGPLISIINQADAPTNLPTGQSHGAGFSIQVPSFQMASACVKLTKLTSIKLL